MTDDQRREIFERDGWRCQYNGCSSNQIHIAHRINQGETARRTIKNYLLREHGLDITLSEVKRNYQDHPFNVVSSCHDHNDSFNCFFKNNEFKIIVEKIYKEGQK